MNNRFLTILLLLAVTILILSACGQNQQAAPKTETKQDGIQLPVISKTVYTNLSLPAWLFTLPEGDYTIGIASEPARNKTVQTTAAKDFAALSLAQNAGSFEFDKTDLTAAEYKVILNVDLTKQNSISKQLQTLAETKAKGYKLYLMGTGNPTLNTDLIKVSASTTPKWCRVNEITEDEQYYYVVGKAVDAKLDIAWKSAQDNALIKLAQYRLQNTKAGTVKLDFNATLAQTWFYHKTENTAPVFNVFLQLKVKK